MNYVVIRDMSAGNESVGEMWQETKIFDGNATLEEVMEWADPSPWGFASKKKITLTRPDQSAKDKSS